MPPKAARGAARGRGRGRGKATAGAAGESSAILPGQTVADRPSASQASASISTDAPASIVTPPQLLNEEAEPSPNSSPATIPTETPAPTPARPALARSESSNSNAPQTGLPAVPARGGRGGRGGVRGGAAKPPAPSRFKPKNIRRDASELEEIARKEHDRLNAIAAENAREASRLARGRGRPLRGRGDAMGRGGSGRKTTASGTFGIAPEALKTATGSVMSFNREGGGGGAGGGSRGAGGAAGGFNIKREGGGGSHLGPSGSGQGNERDWVPEPQYPHEDDDVMKVDIEQINLISDEEDDQPYHLGSRSKYNGNGKGPTKGLRPVRLMREEHKERVLLVNTDAPTKAPPDSDDELPTIDELRSSSNNAPQGKEFKGVYQDPNEVRIKDEPRTTPEPSAPEVKTSPDSRRKMQDSLASSVPMIIDSAPEGEALTTAKRDHKAKRPGKKQDNNKTVHQTEEDRAEYHRHLDDVDILAKELTGLQSLPSSGKGKDVEGDVVMDGVADAAEGEKEGNGRLYLFQFPPVLPELYNPKDPKPRNPILVKREEEEAAARAKEELEILGSLGAKAKSKIKDRPDLTGEPAPLLVKKEEEGVETAAEKLKREEEEKKKKKEKPAVVHEEGYVGKLVVRKSGKVELVWGGTTLIVGRGAEASFLTTGVIVDSVEVGPPGGGVPQGKAVGMGQIMGKFVVTPDWQNY